MRPHTRKAKVATILVSAMAAALVAGQVVASALDDGPRGESAPTLVPIAMRFIPAARP